MDTKEKAVVFFVLGLLIGIQFFDGGPPFYSKIEVQTETGTGTSSADYLEITKWSIPFMRSSITIAYYDADFDSGTHSQKCIYEILSIQHFGK